MLLSFPEYFDLLKNEQSSSAIFFALSPSKITSTVVGSVLTSELYGSLNKIISPSDIESKPDILSFSSLWAEKIGSTKIIVNITAIIKTATADTIMTAFTESFLFFLILLYDYGIIFRK